MKPTKKILIIGELYRPLIPWLLEDKAPSGVPAVYNLYKYLGQSDQYRFHSIIFNRSVNKTKTFPNGSVIELKKFSIPIYYLWKLLVFIRLLFWTNKKLKAEKFDLVYGLSTFSTIAAIIGEKRRVPSVGRIYGTILTKEVEQRNYFRLYSRFLFDILAIKRPADLIICTQDGTNYEKVFHFFNKSRNVTLFYNGMDVTLRNKLLNFENVKKIDEPLRLCYIARLEYYKRQELAIEIVDRLVHQYDLEVVFTIVGSGSRAAVLKQMVKTKQLTKQVIFIEEMPHDEIPDFLKGQDGAMFFYEGGSLGNILWESALAGKLIITIDNAGTGTLFKDGQNSLIAADDEDFVETMAEKLASYSNKDLSTITNASRKMVAGLISDWETRFGKEFDFIFSTDKKPPNGSG